MNHFSRRDRVFKNPAPACVPSSHQPFSKSSADRPPRPPAVAPVVYDPVERFHLHSFVPLVALVLDPHDQGKLAKATVTRPGSWTHRSPAYINLATRKLLRRYGGEDRCRISRSVEKGSVRRIHFSHRIQIGRRANLALRLPRGRPALVTKRSLPARQVPV